MGLTNLLQSQIEAQQQLDAIEYGLRSMKVCGGWNRCVGIHAGQLARARHEAAKVLGRYVAAEGDAHEATGGVHDGALIAVQLDNGCKGLLELAKKTAAESLKAVKAEVKAQGTMAQRRLLLVAEAGAHEYALAA